MRIEASKGIGWPLLNLKIHISHFLLVFVCLWLGEGGGQGGGTGGGGGGGYAAIVVIQTISTSTLLATQTPVNC